MISQEALDASTWGIGWGRTRHLVDHDASRLRVPDYRSYHDYLVAQCSQYTRLLDLDGDPKHRASVFAKRACSHCAKLAPPVTGLFVADPGEGDRELSVWRDYGDGSPDLVAERRLLPDDEVWARITDGLPIRKT